MHRPELKIRADKVRWFNAMDFGDFQARGREAPGATCFNQSLFATFDMIQSLDLTGRRCIDIASASGLVALGMKYLNASYVAAADAARHEAFDIAIELMGLDIDYRIRGVEHLASIPEWQNSFDLVVSSGLMYHLWSPFHLIWTAKRLLKPNGLFILQTFCETSDPKAALYLNSERNINGDHTTYFVPGTTAVEGMLKAGLFNIVARRDQPSKFNAWMARSVSDPDHVANRAGNIKRNHDWLKTVPEYNFGGYDFADFCPKGEPSTIKGKMIEPLATVDPETYVSTFPFNPRQLSNPVGLKFR